MEDNYSQLYACIILSMDCMDKDPQKRPTTEQIIDTLNKTKECQVWLFLSRISSFFMMHTLFFYDFSVSWYWSWKWSSRFLTCPYFLGSSAVEDPSIFRTPWRCLLSVSAITFSKCYFPSNASFKLSSIAITSKTLSLIWKKYMSWLDTLQKKKDFSP
jgi:hypothetical protein